MSLNLLCEDALQVLSKHGWVFSYSKTSALQEPTEQKEANQTGNSALFEGPYGLSESAIASLSDDPLMLKVAVPRNASFELSSRSPSAGGASSLLPTPPNIGESINCPDDDADRFEKCFIFDFRLFCVAIEDAAVDAERVE